MTKLQISAQARLAISSTRTLDEKIQLQYDFGYFSGKEVERLEKLAATKTINKKDKK